MPKFRLPSGCRELNKFETICDGDVYWDTKREKKYGSCKKTIGRKYELEKILKDQNLSSDLIIITERVYYPPIFITAIVNITFERLF